MKILIVNSLYPPSKIGGAEKSVALMARAFARAGEVVRVATLHDAPESSYAEEEGVGVHRLPIDNGYWPYGDVDAGRPALARLGWHARNSWNVKAAARVGAVIDRERPDVVHCNILTGFSVAVWDAVKKRNVPLVQTLRDYSVICTRSSLFKKARNCAQRCTECRLLTAPGKRASRMVDQLVSNSQYVIEAHKREGYFEGVPARRIFNMVPLREQPRDPAPADAPLVFGFIGRVEAEKGIEVVLEACSRLRAPDWRLRVAGVGVSSYVAELQRRFPDPRIEWLGFSEADAFYSSIDVALISSVWAEPLPRTLIESLGHGLSAICSSAGGIPEIADLARLSITYPPTDSDALAAAMTVALDNAADWRAGGLKDPASLGLFAEEVVIAQNRQAYLDAIATAGARR